MIETNRLIKILVEQNSFAFTGRINILDEGSAQLIGKLLLREGEVLFAEYKRLVGTKALIRVSLDAAAAAPPRFVIEPELLDSFSINIPFTFPVLIKKLLGEIQNFIRTQGLRPSGNLKVKIRPSFLSSGDKIDSAEFEVLCTLVDCVLVQDLYERSQLMDYEITSSLLSLRKKNALIIA